MKLQIIVIDLNILKNIIYDKGDISNQCGKMDKLGVGGKS